MVVGVLGVVVGLDLLLLDLMAALVLVMVCLRVVCVLDRDVLTVVSVVFLLSEVVKCVRPWPLRR